MANRYYHNESGEKIGPVTSRELKQLVQQGTVTPEMFVEDPDGRTGLAKDVKGLTFPETVPSTPPLPTTPSPFTATTPSPFTAALPVPTTASAMSNTGDFAQEITQYDGGPSRKINKVIIVENTVRGADTFFALLFPFQDNFYADKLEKQFSETVAEHNRQGWNVVSVTYGYAPHAKLSGFLSLLLLLCAVLLTVFTGGIYLVLYILLAFFKRGRIDQYTVMLERTIGSENASGSL